MTPARTARGTPRSTTPWTAVSRSRGATSPIDAVRRARRTFGRSTGRRRSGRDPSCAKAGHDGAASWESAPDEHDPRPVPCLPFRHASSAGVTTAKRCRERRLAVGRCRCRISEVVAKNSMPQGSTGEERQTRAKKGAPRPLRQALRPSGVAHKPFLRRCSAARGEKKERFKEPPFWGATRSGARSLFEKSTRPATTEPGGLLDLALAALTLTSATRAECWIFVGFPNHAERPFASSRREKGRLACGFRSWAVLGSNQ